MSFLPKILYFQCFRVFCRGKKLLQNSYKLFTSALGNAAASINLLIQCCDTSPKVIIWTFADNFLKIQRLRNVYAVAITASVSYFKNSCRNREIFRNLIETIRNKKIIDRENKICYYYDAKFDIEIPAGLQDKSCHFLCRSCGGFLCDFGIFHVQFLLCWKSKPSQHIK